MYRRFSPLQRLTPLYSDITSRITSQKTDYTLGNESYQEYVIENKWALRAVGPKSALPTTDKYAVYWAFHPSTSTNGSNNGYDYLCYTSTSYNPESFEIDFLGQEIKPVYYDLFQGWSYNNGYLKYYINDWKVMGLPTDSDEWVPLDIQTGKGWSDSRQLITYPLIEDDKIYRKIRFVITQKSGGMVQRFELYGHVVL